MERRYQTAKTTHKGHLRFQRDIKSPLFFGGVIACAVASLVMAVYSVILWPTWAGAANWISSIMQYDIMLIDELLAFAYLICKALPYVLSVCCVLQLVLSGALLLLQRQAATQKASIYLTVMRYALVVQMVLGAAALVVLSVILLCFVFGNAPTYGAIYQLLFAGLTLLLLLIGGVAEYYAVGLYRMLGEICQVILEKRDSFTVPSRVYYVNWVVAVAVFLLPLLTPPIINGILSSVMKSTMGGALQAVVGEMSLSVGWNAYLSVSGVLYGAFLCILSLFCKIHRSGQKKITDPVKRRQYIR